jgi:hypothetical protein
MSSLASELETLEMNWFSGLLKSELDEVSCSTSVGYFLVFARSPDAMEETRPILSRRFFRL